MPEADAFELKQDSGSFVEIQPHAQIGSQYVSEDQALTGKMTLLR